MEEKYMKLHEYRQDTRKAIAAIIDYVKIHQGDKGFINTSSSELDVIWAMLYECDYDGYAMYSEVPITAIRVRNDSLQLVLDGGYDVDDDEIQDYDEDNWVLINDDRIYMFVTVASILDELEYYESGE